MAYQFDPSAWVDNVTKPKKADYVAIQGDIHVAGANRDGGGYARTNTSALGLIPGAYPGATYTVTSAAWSASVATFTIGAHAIALNQLVTITGVTPTGYNVASAKVTGITGTAFSIALATNPGGWSSGGSVLVGTVPGVGTVASGPAGGIAVYNGSGWGSANTGTPRAIASGPSPTSLPNLTWTTLGCSVDVITPLGITRSGGVLTAPITGVYLLIGSISFWPWGPPLAGERGVQWYSPSRGAGLNSAAMRQATTTDLMAAPAHIVALNAGESACLQAYQSAGGALNCNVLSIGMVQLF